MILFLSLCLVILLVIFFNQNHGDQSVDRESTTHSQGIKIQKQDTKIKGESNQVTVTVENEE